MIGKKKVEPGKVMDEMSEVELNTFCNAECAKACEAAQAHLMLAYEAALRLGHSTGFHDWLSMAFGDLAPEAKRISRELPNNKRRTALVSPWFGRQ